MSRGKRTHLYSFHSQRGELTSFGGFDMPLQYTSIIGESMAVRNCVGVFDVSHMGRFMISGTQAVNFINNIVTNDVQRLEEYNGLYAIICNQEGGTLDDVTVLRLEDSNFVMVVNASNREKCFRWLTRKNEPFGCSVADVSDEIAMFAVQGPKAKETLQKVSNSNLSEIRRWGCAKASLATQPCLVSRTGYTGEDGFEIMVIGTPIQQPEKALQVWHQILETGKEYGIEACGLGARDILRLEAGMCLYGNELDESTTPLEAKLEFAVKFQKDDFVGKERLVEQKRQGVRKIRVGLRLQDRGIPRAGYDVVCGGQLLGKITSGTYSPTLRAGIAMSYLPPEFAKEGEVVQVKIRGKLADAHIAAFPFYDQERYGWRRRSP